MYKICFFVPEDSAEKVKAAMFSQGAGRIGNYECCAWQTKGVGQFRPLAGSHPYIGHQDKMEFVEEIKVEMVCEEKYVREVIRAMKETHPYEVPAYEVFKIEL